MRGESPARLRIYCICGQKMRVSATMLGRPGKCVACRQKIRIPRLEELPAGTKEVYLREHPEFLRKADLAPLESDDSTEGGDALEVEPIAESPEPIEAIPLEPMENLQILCSMEQTIQRQLDALRRKEPVSGLDKPTLLRYRALVRTARAGLDEQLRIRLHEVTDQLANNNEQSARATLAVRVGEMDYQTYLRTIVPLRHRRERLERRRQNLRGWLAVADPYMAGGYLETRLENVPTSTMEVTFALETDSDEPVVDPTVEELREALRKRELAEHKLTEWKRMEREGALRGAALEECLADSEAVRHRARAAVAFYRSRLEQVVQDCENDINAIKAHLDLARGRFEKNDLDEPGYQAIELELLRAQSDNARARDLARRALSANTSSDVPHIRGTFLHRMAVPGRPGSIGWDSWIAWVAAALMVLNILVPLSRAQVGGNMVVMRGMALSLFIGSVFLAMLASIPRRNVRGALINLFFVVGVLLGSWNLHQAWYGLESVGSALRMAPHWFLGPGILLFAFISVLMALSAWIALIPVPRWRWLPPSVTAFALFMSAVLFTDGAGLFVGRPLMDGPEVLSALHDSDVYDVTFTVGNKGLRTIWLGGKLDKVPSPVTFLIEEKIGPESWKDAGLPIGYKQSQVQWWTTVDSATFPMIDIAPGDKVTLRYNLPAGNYRVQVTSPIRGFVSKTKIFSLDPLPETDLNPPPAAAEEPVETTPADPAAAEETLGQGDPPAPSTATDTQHVDVQLLGVIHGPDRKPSFRVEIRYPGNRTERDNVVIGDVLCGPWKAMEYSPLKKTLTISNGDKLIILEAGQSYSVEVMP